MMLRMKLKLICLVFSALAMLASPMAVMAQEEGPVPEARLEGYPAPVTLPPSGSAVSWILLLVMAGACAGVMFKQAKRTHMD